MKKYKIYKRITMVLHMTLLMLLQTACGQKTPTEFVLPKEAVTAEEYIKALKSQCDVLSDEAVTAGIQMLADKRIEEIRSTPTQVEVTGTKYYVAADGNDFYDGLSPDKPWQSMKRVSEAALNPGDGVFFKRGDVFTGELMAKEGVTYSAYGEGEKPRLYARGKNTADPKYWEKTEIENVWVYSQILYEDIGNIVFDGTTNARKIYRSEETDGRCLDSHTGQEFYTWKDLTEDMSFYHEADAKIYLKCEAGNPGELFEEIWLVPKKAVIRVGKNNHVTIDNLHLAYANFGISSIENEGLTVQNCEFSWIGGCIQKGPGEYSASRTFPTPYGNGVEVYGGEITNYTVDNCYFWQIYDAAMTNQGSGSDKIAVENVRYTNNVVEKAVYAIEIFHRESEQAKAENSVNGIYIENNILRMGGGFGHFARPDQEVTALIRNGKLINNTTNYVVSNNIFDRSMSKIIQAQDDGGSKAMYYDNIYVQKRGLIFANRLGLKILVDENMEALLEGTNTEHNSTYIIVEDIGYEKY